MDDGQSPPAAAIKETSAPSLKGKGTRREVFAWAMYDWANSAYSTLAITILVSYIKDDVFPGKMGTIVWGWGLGGTMLVAAVLSPILGAVADAHASKRRWLIGTAVPGAIASCLMYFSSPEQPWIMLALFLTASLCFELSFGFYNGFLPEIADESTMDRVSAWGFALGYVGGGLALLMVILLFQFGAQIGLNGDIAQIKRIGLAIMGAWWFLFALPMFVIVRDKTPPARHPEPFRMAARRAVGEVIGTIRHVRAYKVLALFLLGFLFYNEGVQTMISQSSVFAIEVLEMKAGELAQVVLMIQFIALPGSLLVGWLSTRLGQKSTLIGCLVIWILLLVMAFFVTKKWQFWVMAAVAALVLGGTQSVSRAVMGMMTPPEKSAEFFGFFNLSGRAVSVMGPVVFSTVLVATDSPHWAILSLLSFFVIGLLITLPLNVRRGQEQARTGQ